MIVMQIEVTSESDNDGPKARKMRQPSVTGAPWETYL